MRLFLFIIFLTLTSYHVNGQLNDKKENRKLKKEEKEPEFETAGEQEAYWTQQFFKKEYKKQKHNKFTGTITKVNETTFKYDTNTLRVINTPKDLLPIFEEGLLGAWASNVTIGGVEELPDLNVNPKSRRFSCVVSLKGFGNPVVYFFELTNNAASPSTDMQAFIKGSKLTFLKQGWVRI